ncbi:MAG: allantoate amidohydrolase [Pseudomonadota bacterium]
MSTPAGSKVFDYIEQLAAISEEEGRLTRVSLSEQHRQANNFIAARMREAGMLVHTDAIGNIVGRLEGESDKRALLLGSHLDTVRDAGRFDGMLGVVAPIVCIEQLQQRGIKLPFAVEIVGFCDEEGVRFPSTLLGSRAIAGTLDPAVLNECDANNISLASALEAFGQDPAKISSARRNADEFLGFVEVHIEQGPVLEREDLPVGLVSAISGAGRYSIVVDGIAAHAGTVPMGLRRDALVAASQCIVDIERICSTLPDVVGTVGVIDAMPGAGNVIPGRVEFSLDLRSSRDSTRADAEQQIFNAIDHIAATRQVSITWQQTYEANSVTCDEGLSAQIANAIERSDYRVHSLPSGAGHDAMALAELTNVAMLFVRCAGGISHNPEESITEADADAAVQVLCELLIQFDCG